MGSSAYDAAWDERLAGSGVVVLDGTRVLKRRRAPGRGRLESGARAESLWPIRGRALFFRDAGGAITARVRALAKVRNRPGRAAYSGIARRACAANAVKPPASKAARKTWRPPFEVLLVAEQSRLGRDAQLLPFYLVQIINAGVKIVEVRSGQEVSLDGNAALIATIQAHTAEMERKKVAERQRPAKRKRAEQGLVAGGKTFGYTNVKGNDGAVRYAINECEAAVVRQVFELVAGDIGYTAIVKKLRDEHAPSPRGAGRSAQGLRKIIARELYRGELVYGKTEVKWPERGKGSVQVAVPESKWLRRPVPGARIVTDVLWHAANRRVARDRKSFASVRDGQGRLHGRAESSLVREHLLSDFLRCGTCGGNLFILNLKASAKSQPTRFYVCTTTHKRGAERCANNIRVPYERLNDAVIASIRSKLFRSDVIDRFIRDEEAASSVEAIASERAALEDEVKKLDGEIKRLLILADDADGDFEALRARVAEKRAARTSKVERIEKLVARQGRTSPALKLAASWVKSYKLEEDGTIGMLGVNLAEMFKSDVPQARQILRGFLRGGFITIKPEAQDVADLRFHSVVFSFEGDLGTFLDRLHQRVERLSTTGTSAGSRCPRSGERPPSSARARGRGSYALPRGPCRRVAPSTPSGQRRGP